MEYCFTSDLDLLEVFKAVTPWLLALVVYLVWHKQKGKEVLSNEAKNYITLLIQLEKLEAKIHAQLRNNSHRNKLIESHENYKETYNDLSKSITFITYSLKKDPEYIRRSTKVLDELSSSRSRLIKYLNSEDTNYIRINENVTERIKEYLYDYVVFKKW